MEEAWLLAVWVVVGVALLVAFAGVALAYYVRRQQSKREQASRREEDMAQYVEDWDWVDFQNLGGEVRTDIEPAGTRSAQRSVSEKDEEFDAVIEEAFTSLKKRKNGSATASDDGSKTSSEGWKNEEVDTKARRGGGGKRDEQKVEAQKPHRVLSPDDITIHMNADQCEQRSDSAATTEAAAKNETEAAVRMGKGSDESVTSNRGSRDEDRKDRSLYYRDYHDITFSE